MIVYRVQHKKDGIGPYKGEVDHNDGYLFHLMREKNLEKLGDTLRSHHQGSTHPDIKKDTKRQFNFKDICGFDSPQALYHWFEGFHDDLRENGYKIFKFKVPKEKVKLSISGLQLAFHRGAAELLDIIEL